MHWCRMIGWIIGQMKMGLESIFFGSVFVSPNLGNIHFPETEKLGLFSAQVGFFCPFKDWFPKNSELPYYLNTPVPQTKG